MKKFVIAVALCAALAACKKEEPVPADAAAPAADAAAPATDAAAPAADAAAPAADAAAAAAPANSGLPVECENYLNRAKACFAKSSGNAAAAGTGVFFGRMTVRSSSGSLMGFAPIPFRAPSRCR